MRRWSKDFFIPHEGNEYKPHSLQKAAVFGMAALILLSFTLANLQSLIWMSSDWMVSTILPSVIVDLTNNEREDSSLGDLRRSAILDQAARLKAEDMASNEYFAHYSPTGISPWHWFAQTDYNFVHAGENLAIHFTDSDEVVDAWMDSPTHRANIMNGDFTEIGVAAVEGYYEGYKTVYVVQLFGTPAAAAEPEPEPPEPAVLAEAEDAPETATATPTSTPETQTATETPTTTPQSETNPVIAGSDDVVTTVDDTEISLSTDRDPVEVTPTSTATEVATATEIAEVVTTEQSVALYSDLISTSTGGVPATIDPNAPAAGSTEAGIFGVVTQPQMVLQILYSIIALFVVGALILAVVIEIRRQHPVQIAYSTGLMAVMGMLYYVHVTVTSGAVIL